MLVHLGYISDEISNRPPRAGGNRLGQAPVRGGGEPQSIVADVVDEGRVFDEASIAGARNEAAQVTGIEPAIVVPAPGWDRTSRVPPSAEIRSSMLVSPNPRSAISALKPIPSSSTLNAMRLPLPESRITARLACAYYATFCRASRMQM